MIDYLLKFPTKEIAEQFGIGSGYALVDENGVVVSNIASHQHALLEIGPHNGENYWILFRDLVGIPIPAGADQFIYWASSWTVLDENGDEISVPRPTEDPNVPDVFWA